MRKRSGAVIVDSYEELLDEVYPSQMKHRDQTVPDTGSGTLGDTQSTLPDEEDDGDQLDVQVQTIKVLLVGKEGVGKGALVRQFIEHRFDPDYQPTEG